MTTVRTIAYTYISKLLQATYITSKEGAEIRYLGCQACGKKFLVLSEDTTRRTSASPPSTTSSRSTPQCGEPS